MRVRSWACLAFLTVLLTTLSISSATAQQRQSRDTDASGDVPAVAPEKRVIQGETLPPEALGPSVIEPWAAGDARQRELDELGPQYKDTAPFDRAGEWSVPSRRSTYTPRSGKHYITNKYGDMEIGVGFPSPVTMNGVWLVGQGASGVWPEAVRVVGFRGKQQVAATQWFEAIGHEPSWLAIEIPGVDRIVFEAKPSKFGTAWFGVDDFTYTRPKEDEPDATESVVLDFDDLNFRTTVTGSGYGGLDWERGAGDFPQADPVHSPVVPPGFEEEDVEPDEAPEPAPRGTATLPELTASYVGVVRGDAGQFSYPPDTCGAAGFNQFVIVVNRVIGIYDKANGLPFSLQALTSFQPGTNGDPRVAYDPHHQRWIVTSTDFNDRIYLAISATDNAVGAWFKTSFIVTQGVDANRWPDYPTLGVDANGIYIGAYMVGGGHSLFVVDKAPLLDPVNPTLGTVTAFRGLPYEGALQPAITWGDSGGEYIVSRANSTQMRVRQVTGPLTSPSLVEVGFASVPGNGNPPDAPALGANTDMDTVGSRLMNAQWIDGSIWTANATNVSGRAGVRWYRIYTDTLFDESGLISHPSLYYYFPSIACNIDGDLAMAFSGSDATQYVSAYYTGREAEDPAGIMAEPFEYTPGRAPQNNIDQYGRNRWGDYSLTVLDPSDERTFWTIQAYAHATNIWGTTFAKLEFEDVIRPPNDDCAGYISLTQNVPVDFTTINAQTKGGEEPSCGLSGGDQIESDIWFEYISDCTGDITIDVCDVDYDSRIAVYLAVCGGPPDTAIACDDDGCGGRGGLGSLLTFPGNMGSTYYIRVGGSPDEQGTGTIVVSCDDATGTCLGDIVDPPGTVDVFDLIELLKNWDTDGPGADFAPPNDVVDVFDLIALLDAWGDCP